MRGLAAICVIVCFVCVSMCETVDAQCRVGRSSCINSVHGSSFGARSFNTFGVSATPVFVHAPRSFGFVNVHQRAPIGAFAVSRHPSVNVNVQRRGLFGRRSNVNVNSGFSAGVNVNVARGGFRCR